MNYQLFHGDCLEVMPTLGGVDAVITDPPYKMTSGGKNTGEFGGHFKPSVYNNNGKLFEVPKFSDWLGKLFGAMKDDADFYTMISAKEMKDMLVQAEIYEFKLHNIITWKKNTKVANRWYMKQAEYILYFWKGKAQTINNPSTPNILEVNNVVGKCHPSEKPVELMKILIDNSTKEGDTILDPFMGSGTTGVACAETKRKFIGIEKEKKYFDIAKKRIELAYRQEVMF